jgi:hypothetical protein
LAQDTNDPKPTPTRYVPGYGHSYFVSRASVSTEKIIMEEKYERGLYPKHNHRICKRAQKLMNMSTQNRSYLSTSEFMEELILYQS